MVSSVVMALAAARGAMLVAMVMAQGTAGLHKDLATETVAVIGQGRVAARLSSRPSSASTGRDLRSVGRFMAHSS